MKASTSPQRFRFTVMWAAKAMANRCPRTALRRVPRGVRSCVRESRADSAAKQPRGRTFSAQKEFGTRSHGQTDVRQWLIVNHIFLSMGSPKKKKWDLP